MGSRKEHGNYYLRETLHPLSHLGSNNCIGYDPTQFVYNKIVEEPVNEKRNMLLVELMSSKTFLIQFDNLSAALLIHGKYLATEIDGNMQVVSREGGGSSKWGERRHERCPIQE